MRMSEKFVRFENLMKNGFQKTQILQGFISQCEIWYM